MAEKDIIENDDEDDEDDEDESVSPLGCLVMVVVMGLVGFFGYRGCARARREQEQSLQKIVLTQSQDHYIRGEIIDTTFVPEQRGGACTSGVRAMYLVKIKSGTEEYNIDLCPTASLSPNLFNLTFKKGNRVKFPKYFNVEEAGFRSEAGRLGISLESYTNQERFPNKSGMLDGDLLLKDSN